VYSVKIKVRNIKNATIGQLK